MNRRALYGISLLVLVLLPGVAGVMAGRRGVERGVNDAGGEFWAGREAVDRNEDPYSSDRTVRYLAQRGLRLVRLAVRWERLQPRLGGPLVERELEYLRRYLRDASAAGLEVIIDLHNGARYLQPFGEVQLGEKELPIEQFCDFWQRLAGTLREVPGLYGYGLMNEPANMPTDTWKAASQAALEAIRRTGDRHCVLVPGNNYASAQIWVMCHGRHGWIRDSADNFMYEAHVYLDADGSGRYTRSFQEELAQDPELRTRGANRLRVFTEWCHENGVRGFIGEFGAPNEEAWLGPLAQTLEFMDLEHLDGTMWAAGERWPTDYLLSLQPLDDFRRDRLAMQVLLRHLHGGGSITYDFVQGYVSLWRRARQWVRDRL